MVEVYTFQISVQTGLPQGRGESLAMEQGFVCRKDMFWRTFFSLVLFQVFWNPARKKHENFPAFSKTMEELSSKGKCAQYVSP